MPVVHHPSVNFSHTCIHFLLQNHWSNFSQTWYKARGFKFVQMQSNTFLQGETIMKLLKIHRQNLKSFSLHNHRGNLTKLNKILKSFQNQQFWKRRFCCQYIFPKVGSSPFEKRHGLSLNKLEFPLLKNALCQVQLKWAQSFRKCEIFTDTAWRTGNHSSFLLRCRSEKRKPCIFTI